MSSHFDDRIVADFLRRSYFAVDGLWFVKAEENYSFGDALRLDESVWRIMPKIQSRRARELLGIDGGSLEGLIRCFELKLVSEGYCYEINRSSDQEAEIVISTCPWYSILVKAGREHLAAQIADVICSNEFKVWADEFSKDLTSVITERLCDGCSRCVVRFECKRAQD